MTILSNRHFLMSRELTQVRVILNSQFSILNCGAEETVPIVPSGAW